MSTKIEWCDEVWNPITGCTHAGAGCDRCYARAIAGRFWKGRQFSDVQFHEDRIERPMHWKKPRRIFVNSMGDWLHDKVSPEWVSRVLDIVQSCPQHQFLTLTKRIHNYERKVHGLPPEYRPRPNTFLPSHWNGITVCTQPDADRDIPQLLQIPAAVRFASLEPLLGPIELWFRSDGAVLCRECCCVLGCENPKHRWRSECKTCNGTGQIGRLDWVIVGPETGPGRRPCKLEWIESIVDQCHAAGVPVFVKAVPILGRPIHHPDIIAEALRCKVEDIRQFPRSKDATQNTPT